MRLDLHRITYRFALWLALVAGVGALLLTQPLAAADTLDLSGTWMFRADWNEDGLAQRWQQPGVDESQWRTITVPGRWEDQGVKKSNPLWPSQNEEDGYNGYGWYRRTVSVPAEWSAGRVRLHIEGVDGRDWAFANGTQVGAATSEDEIEAPRDYQIPAGVLKPGEANLIAIRVFDTGGFGGITAGPVELVRDGEPVAPAEPQPTEGAPAGSEERFYDVRNDQINVGGSVHVDYNTKVEGDAVAVGGMVQVLGWVTGDAVAVGGSVIVGPEGRVDGEVASIGGTVERQQGGYVGGQEVHIGGISGDLLRTLISQSLGFAHAPAAPREYDFWSRFVFFLVPGVFVSLLAVLLFPKRMMVMANSLPVHPGRVAITGVVGLILAPGGALGLLVLGAIAAVISVVTIVGPIVVLGGMAAIYLLSFAAVVMGCAAVWLSLGKAVLDRSGRTQAHPLAAALVGAVILAIAAALPAIGVLVTLTAIVFGFGLALMTGAGKHQDWLSQKPYRLRRRQPPEVGEQVATGQPDLSEPRPQGNQQESPGGPATQPAGRPGSYGSPPTPTPPPAQGPPPDAGQGI